jgi:hypothetical protein
MITFMLLFFLVKCSNPADEEHREKGAKKWQTQLQVILP